MNKVMKLNVFFEGNYGGDVDEVLILPLNINGVLFEKLEEGYHYNEVYLGEIEGKHSECYGDLTVETIDLDKLDMKEVSDLLNKSDFNEFEAFFERVELEFEEESEYYDDDKINMLVSSYGIEDFYGIMTEPIYNVFIKELRSCYAENFRNITILEQDYQATLDLIKYNNIWVFE